MVKRKNKKEIWFWELCADCGEHGRFVHESRYDYTFECGSKTEALFMLDAIKARLDQKLVDKLYQEWKMSILPEQNSGVRAELRGLLENWNDAAGSTLEGSDRPLDPVEFHKFAGHLVATNRKTKH